MTVTTDRDVRVPGADGSWEAVRLREPRAQTPKPVWNPDLPTDTDFRAQWEEVPDIEEYPNGFRAQWEQFLRDVDAGRPHGYDLAAGVRGLQLVEAGLQSSEEGRRIVIGEQA